MPNDVKANRKAWVEALRSGKYKQGKGLLHQRSLDGEEYFCCLGVACDLYIEAGGELNRYLNGSIYEYKSESGALWNSVAPYSVRDWFGLKHLNGNFSDDKSLASLNDSGKTFEEIADIIESEPPGLFVEEESTFAP